MLNCLREGTEIFDGLGKGVLTLKTVTHPVKTGTVTPCEPNFPHKIKTLIGPQTGFFQG